MSMDAEPRQGTIRVRIADEAGRGTIDHAIEPERFDTSDRGVQVGALFVPWHRVVSFDSVFRQDYVNEPEGDGFTKVTMRVALKLDGGPSKTLEVASDRFETSPTHLTLLTDLRVEPESGKVVMQRLSVPWPRVMQYERVLTRPAPRADIESQGTRAPS